jgi:aminoglycoside phosphotransferase (APT) family kinase protein
MTGTEQERFAEFARAAGLGAATLGPVIAGGNSNITRQVTSADGALVLRHPPVDTISDKAAAGIRREFVALQALLGKAPVPEPIAWCDDATVLGQPFSLTRFVPGLSIRDRLPPDYGSGADAINRTGEALIDAIAKVHAADPAPMIAAGMGHADGFVQRQIDRWRQVRQKHSVRALPQIDDIGAWLAANAPAPLPGRIVHCDYHLDNCLSDPARPSVNAIIDWEMATVADPRIDLGLALYFWRREPSAELGFPWIQAFSNRPDSLSRGELAQRWSEGSGLPANDIEYFIAFSGWRLAAIVEGAYVLFRNGKVDNDYARHLEHDVPALLSEVANLIEHEAA